MKQLLWFVGAFAITLAICLVGWGVITFQTVTPGGRVTKTVDSLLFDLEIPTTDITEAESRRPVFLTEIIQPFAKDVQSEFIDEYPFAALRIWQERQIRHCNAHPSSRKTHSYAGRYGE